MVLEIQRIDASDVFWCGSARFLSDVSWMYLLIPHAFVPIYLSRGSATNVRNLPSRPSAPENSNKWINDRTMMTISKTSFGSIGRQISTAPISTCLDRGCPAIPGFVDA